MARLTKARSWPVRANGLLLILQAAGLGGIGAYNIYQVDWQQLLQQAENGETPPLEVTEAVEHVVVVIVTFGPPAILAILAALGFLFLFRVGWLLAMLVQALTLLACLLIYSNWTPVSGWNPMFIYPVMLYCIVMVLYLNSSDVRKAFQMRRRTETRRAVHGP